MKRTCHIELLAAVVSLLLTGVSARANLIQASDPRFGPDSLTIDTSTGLAWLDVNLGTGLSYEQVLADTQPGGLFSGFRYATAPEVLALYVSAGIPGFGYYPLSTPSIPAFMSLVGTTESINGYPGIVALSATSSGGAQDAPAVYATGYNGTEMYWVNGGGYNGSGGTAYGPTTSYPGLGSWLVTSVPDNSGASICVLAAASLMGFGFVQRRLARRRMR